ncbi:hypothetical protein BDA96_09G096400, partial [Sorghum bicolor]
MLGSARSITALTHALTPPHHLEGAMGAGRAANLLGGVIAIIGRNLGNTEVERPNDTKTNVSFLGSSDDVLDGEALNYNIYRAVLEAHQNGFLTPFIALTRGRHHCRFCGGIFCRACSKRRSLLPAKFRERNPQRVCDACYDKLDPLQNLLINSVSNASQTAKHDVMDWTCARGWLNLPVALTMEHEIYKAANTSSSYIQVHKKILMQVARINPEKSDGSWSAPSAIVYVGFGWGAHVFSGELMDFIIVLRGPEAVQTSCSRMHFSLGAGVSAAAGPVGRVLEADLRTGDKESGVCYTYSCSK